MIEAVIFDVGGVYLQGSFIDFANKAYKILGIEGTFKADAEVVFDTDYNRGLISPDECFRKFFGVDISDDQMRSVKQIWMTTWTPDQGMLEYVQKLKQKYTLAVLSNSDALNSQKYHERGWYAYFQHLVLSHEEGILKPDREIYDKVLGKLDLLPEQCVFIDDQEACLVAARNLGKEGRQGMHTILYKSLPQMIQELERLGVQVDQVNSQ